MKIRQLIAVIVVVAAVASCISKKTLSDKLVGKWNGTNNIELTMIDSLGNTVIQAFSAPIEIEYLSDSTFTANVMLDETVIMRIGGIATFADTTAKIEGSINYKTTADFVGQMSISEDKILNLKYSAENPSEGLLHKGEVTATREK